MRADPQLVASLVRTAKDLGELRDLLAANGIRPRTNRGLDRRLRRSWRRANAEEAKRLQAQPLEALDHLPYSEVVAGGIVFRIHGIAHGQGFAAKPGAELKQLVRTAAGSFEQGPDCGYATEGGFVRLFGLPEDRQLRYGQALMRRAGARRIVRMLLSAALIPPVLPFLSVVSRMSRDASMREAVASLSDPRRLVRARRLIALYDLPQPIDAELKMATKRDFGLLHSEEMARELLRVARERGVRKMHAIVGLGHEAEMVWALPRLASG
ncbi:MAG TPA: hypothetical protein VNE62_02205 [Actinomycetota bacterium]|nr:hypothetical protein [Actinomycetota bacterium]